LSDFEDRLSIVIAELISRGEPLRHILWNIGRGFLKRPLGVIDFVERQRIEESRCQSQKHNDLFDHGNGVRLGLLEAGSNTLSVINRPLSRVVEAGSEFSEGLQFLKL
jgi:hypothetical protein